MVRRPQPSKTLESDLLTSDASLSPVLDPAKNWNFPLAVTTEVIRPGGQDWKTSLEKRGSRPLSKSVGTHRHAEMREEV